MERETMDDLIRDFYQGKTSPEEERKLAEMVYDRTADEDISFLKDYFDYMGLLKAAAPDIEFPSELPEGKKRYLFVRRWLKVAIVLLISIGSAWFGFEKFIVAKDQIITAGKVMDIKLDDGSLVWLNTGSKLTVPKSFSDPVRQVFLEGEAYFEVRPDASKPFVVRTGSASVQVLGTSFNLRRSAEELVELTVLTGKVMFGRDSMSEIEAGKRVILDELSGQLSIPQATNDNVLSWKTRKLVFDNAPLNEVIRDIEKHFSTSLRADTSDVLNCRFTGSFNNPGLDELLETLAFSLTLEVEKDGDSYRLIGTNCIQQ